MTTEKPTTFSVLSAFRDSVINRNAFMRITKKRRIFLFHGKVEVWKVVTKGGSVVPPGHHNGWGERKNQTFFHEKIIQKNIISFVCLATKDCMGVPLTPLRVPPSGGTEVWGCLLIRCHAVRICQHSTSGLPQSSVERLFRNSPQIAASHVNFIQGGPQRSGFFSPR